MGSAQTATQQADTTELEMFLIESYLALGYIVASPDYEGPDAAFTPGHLEGMITLDGMGAVVNHGRTLGLIPPTVNPMVVGVGYSGGAIASGWGASLQSSYAPEQNIKGWAAGGTHASEPHRNFVVRQWHC